MRRFFFLSTGLALAVVAVSRHQSTEMANTSGIPDLGIGANMNGYRPFMGNNPWNSKVETLKVHPLSAAYVNSIGIDKALHPDFGANWDGGPFGIPYIVVERTAPKVPVSFDYADESDPGPYPIPGNTPIEGGEDSDGDRHMLIVNRSDKKLYELYYAFPTRSGNAIKSVKAGSGAIFNMNSNKLRPAGWTSADAAGLPIFPGLVRYDEVARGEIKHALRFTVSRTQRAYISPATHFASNDKNPNLPPMGLRFRLKKSFNISTYPPQARVVLQALKTYGMFVADNGSNWYLSGAPDARWDDDQLNTLKKLRGRDFEAVTTSKIVTAAAVVEPSRSGNAA
ncbi:hypothetical protein EON80_07415 [bacterium]|nr:MAG: hypothetical protein EON80_07415 [bacterium]